MIKKNSQNKKLSKIWNFLIFFCPFQIQCRFDRWISDDFYVIDIVMDKKGEWSDSYLNKIKKKLKKLSFFLEFSFLPICTDSTSQIGTENHSFTMLISSFEFTFLKINYELR
ncbi:hypothetical protein BpHYR1_044083 [Brachionus plicatilis]|uniref:Uncharacterized protein n=1 Tax=Brachionus plicatilis TaxID=10195 RepID=A0A3M7QV01_BRAPC|nr:hypothetical protein BpHYR1_044083 [Brachionus plicatilis]